MYEHKNGIRFRKLARTDLEALLALKEESWWGTHQTLFLNFDDQIRWYESLASNQLFMIAERESTMVGVGYFTDIDWIGRSLNIGGSAFKPRNSEHIKAAFAAGLDMAFELLNVQRVGAEVLEYNAAVQQIDIGYLGFTIEGRRRRAVYKAGRYYDSIVLGILREEWEQQPRIKSYGGCCCTNFDLEFAEKAIRRFHRHYPDSGLAPA